ncbi:RING-type E3 ubiquitin transferase [Sarracenia purpurea var. burkii]
MAFALDELAAWEEEKCYECVACPICRLNMAKQSDHVTYGLDVDASIKITPCGHLAHSACLTRWIGSSADASCMTCRTPVSVSQLRMVFIETAQDVQRLPNNDRRALYDLEEYVKVLEGRYEKSEKLRKAASEEANEFQERCQRQERQISQLEDELKREKKMADGWLCVVDRLYDEKDRVERTRGLSLSECNNMASSAMERVQPVEKLRYVDMELESRGIQKTTIEGEEVFRFGEVLMLGDGIIYQLLRSAFKEFLDEIAKIATSPCTVLG